MASTSTREKMAAAARMRSRAAAERAEQDRIVEGRPAKEHKVQVSLWMTESQRRKAKQYALDHDTNVSQLIVDYIDSLEG